jgi:hypothetical protein
MKIVLWSFASLIGVIVLLWTYAFAPFTSPWIEFGYYGQFNQVQRIICSIPELTITDDWQHHDITMEDFGFTVAHRDGPAFRIDFWENSPQMKRSRDADIRHFIDSFVAEQLRGVASSPSLSAPKTP